MITFIKPIHEYTPLRSRWKQPKITTKTIDPITSFTSHRTSELHPDLSILPHQNFHQDGVFLLFTTTNNFIKPTKVRCTFGLPDWRLQECTMYRWLPKQPVVKVQHLGWWKLSSESIGTMSSQSLICLFSGSSDQWDSKTPFMGMIRCCMDYICSLKWYVFFLPFRNEVDYLEQAPAVIDHVYHQKSGCTNLKVLHHNIYIYIHLILYIEIYTHTKVPFLKHHWRVNNPCWPETWWTARLGIFV